MWYGDGWQWVLIKNAKLLKSHLNVSIHSVQSSRVLCTLDVRYSTESRKQCTSLSLQLCILRRAQQGRSKPRDWASIRSLLPAESASPACSIVADQQALCTHATSDCRGAVQYTAMHSIYRAVSRHLTWLIFFFGNSKDGLLHPFTRCVKHSLLYNEHDISFCIIVQYIVFRRKKTSNSWW